ncbi:MAG TPA: methyltransferase [Solirubrobacteraceae bacterium]
MANETQRGDAYAAAVAATWDRPTGSGRSFWHSPVVNAEINRRITGDPAVTPAAYFTARYCQTPRRRGLSLGCGGGSFERELLELNACEHIIGVDISPKRIEGGMAATPSHLKDRLELICADLETWRPSGAFDLVVGKAVLHHLDSLEDWVNTINRLLGADGLLYVSEFVGPSRFQWTDKQLEIVNRLLARLSPELLRDLAANDGRLRPPAGRPDIERFIQDDPSEAIHSGELPALLRGTFETVEERPWGGAVYHLLFSGVMGNFEHHPDLVRVLMEFDSILTEEGVVDNDCLWGIYRAKATSRTYDNTTHTRPSRIDGRIDKVSEGVITGWAYDAAHPNQHLSLDVYIDNKIVRKVMANRPRADLAKADIGDGQHGFEVELPPRLRDGQQHYLEVCTPNPAVALPRAIRFDELSQSSSDGTTFVPMRRDPTPADLPEPRVLVGRDGWLFLCDDANGSLDQLLGDLTLTSADLAHYLNMLGQRHDALAALGIPYVFAIAPAKESVYPQMLPSSVPVATRPRPIDQILQAVADHPALAPLDLRDALREGALDGEPVYYRQDAHWNYRGAWLAVQAIVREVRRRGVVIPSYDEYEIDWQDATPITGDLADKEQVDLLDGRLVAPPGERRIAAEPETEQRPDPWKLPQARSVSPSSDLEVSETRGTVAYESHTDPSLPRALIYGDSYARWLRPYLRGLFSWSAHLWTQNIDAELIQRHRPDVVIQVVAERFLIRPPYGDKL